MREIKFRAWEKKKKRMLHDVYPWLPDDNYFIWMQYTGLKDKNSVEIYEGDMVRFQNKNGEYYVMDNSVGFKDGRFTYGENTTLIDRIEDCDGNVEVIGNIYEDKELPE